MSHYTLATRLITLNQIRRHGILVSDNPYDADKELGIDHPDLFIPFLTEGSAIHFASWVPSDIEFEQCPHIVIVLTDDEIPWDPYSIEMSPNRPYGGQTISELRSVRKAITTKASAAPVECESDLVLGSISSSLTADKMYERLIASVRVNTPRGLRIREEARGK